LATFAQDSTGGLHRAVEDNAATLGRPLVYLPRTNTAKEDLARDIAQGDGIRGGLIAVLRFGAEPAAERAVAGEL
jgi:hypothetical protein